MTHSPGWGCLGHARRSGGRFPLSLSTYLTGVNGRINKETQFKILVPAPLGRSYCTLVDLLAVMLGLIP
jgi:hypothetical protein